MWGVLRISFDDEIEAILLMGKDSASLGSLRYTQIS